MAANRLGPAEERLLAGRGRLQAEFGHEVGDVEQESPAAALDSLEDAIAAASAGYKSYLQEALECYSRDLYRAAILMVWSAVIQHLYSVVGKRRGGVEAFERANKERFGESRRYREIKKVNNLLYLGERDLIQPGEDAGMFDRNARKVLHERLELRNLCGHPTGYTPGREETVVFIESLSLNVLSGDFLSW